MVQMSSIAAATTIGSGVVKKVGTTYVVAGTGDVINVAVTIVFAVIIASIIGNKLKNYTIINASSCFGNSWRIGIIDPPLC